MANDASVLDPLVGISGRRLALPTGPIFQLQRAGDADYEIGAFRAWAGYKDFGAEAATDGLALFQHVLSFGPSEVSGRTGIHCHLSQVHIILPTSGRGVFSYDGVPVEAIPGEVITQHGGTVHDQFIYSYAATGAEENKATPVSLEPAAPDEPARSFGFLELFIPARMANVEIVAPHAVTDADQATAWAHPYHAPGAQYALHDVTEGAWRPVAGAPGLEAQDAGTWAATGGLVATHILRPKTYASTGATALSLTPEGEQGGLEILYMASGSAAFSGAAGEPVRLAAGDCLTVTAGLADAPSAPTPDMRLLRFFISARSEALSERSPEEIARLEALGPAIISARRVRAPADPLPINGLAADG